MRSPLVSTPLAAVICALFVSCAQPPKRAAHSRYDRPVAEESDSAKERKRSADGERIVRVDFKRGAVTLTAAEKKELRSQVRAAKAKGKIDEIRVLAWADRDYSNVDRLASDAEVRLADQRAMAVRDYLRETLELSGIDTHNMAKKPGALAKLFRTDDYQLKTGDYGSKDTGLRIPPSPQKVLVVIETEARRAVRAE